MERNADVGYAVLSSELAAIESLELQASGEDLDTLIEALAPQRARSILEIGCGTGALARRLASKVDRNTRILGIDLSPEHIEYSRAAAKIQQINNVRFEVLDLFASSFEAEFDLVFCRYVFMYIIPCGRAVEFLRIIQNSLTPGGHVALIEADINFGQDRFPPPPDDLAKVMEKVVCYYREKRQIEWRSGIQLYHYLRLSGFCQVDVSLIHGRIIQGGKPVALSKHDGLNLECLLAPVVDSHQVDQIVRVWKTYLEDVESFIYSPIFMGRATFLPTPPTR